MTRASKILESLKKRTKIAEGYATSDRLNEKASKEVLEVNKDREVGDTALNIKGDEIKNSVILAKNPNSIDYAIKKGGEVEIHICNEFDDKEFTFNLDKKQLKVLLDLI